MLILLCIGESKMSKKYIVYCHTLKVDGRKYFGATSQSLSRRWRADGSGYHGENVFYQAIKKYGWDNFTHEILATDLFENEAYEMEKSLIAKYQTQNIKYGFNTSGGGKGITNPTKEMRRKIGEQSRKNNTGRKLTEKHKAILSERMKGENNPNAHGKMLTTDRINKFTEMAKRPKTEATKKKMSQSAKKHHVICKETGEIFNSMKDGALKMNVPYPTFVSSVYRQLPLKGYHFETVTDEELQQYIKNSRGE